MSGGFPLVTIGLAALGLLVAVGGFFLADELDAEEIGFDEKLVFGLDIGRVGAVVVLADAGTGGREDLLAATADGCVVRFFSN